MIKSTPRGELHPVFILTYLPNNGRYVEMLEQQQTWLVRGLQEMYRRANEGEGWPGEPLPCEGNSHPLTHDLLTRLGALDHTKGERLEKNIKTMQQELWRCNTMQRQDLSDASSESAQSPMVPSCFTSPSSSRPTQPIPTIKSEPQQQQQQQSAQLQSQPPMTPSNPAYAAQMSMEGVVDPIALQDPQPWSNNNGFGSFDETDLMSSTDYTNMSFDSLMSSPMFNHQVPMNCIMSTSFLGNNTKNDYEDFNQLLNPDPTGITSI